MSDTESQPSTSYPTDWHTADELNKIEVRQTSEDTFQLRSPTHTITITKEGFDIFRSSNLGLWNSYLANNNIEFHPRDDISGD
ncbi:MAG TPA: hypothetical protein VGD31_11850 [Sphingobacteriaceae bacterium]